jgi:hypothetical protein
MQICPNGEGENLFKKERLIVKVGENFKRI